MINPFHGVIFALRDKNDPMKEEKYHAAAGISACA
jgi:hypothetical protein